MSQAVVNGALLQCSFGVAPSSLVVLPMNRVTAEGMPQANIMDNKPLVNILPFGVCSSLANPATASLTAAALGVLTPGPCIPVTTAPWFPGSPTALVANMPALSNSCKCVCAYGGMINVQMAGTMKTTVP
jgi:hypothetical protein